MSVLTLRRLGTERKREKNSLYPRDTCQRWGASTARQEERTQAERREWMEVAFSLCPWELSLGLVRFTLLCEVNERRGWLHSDSESTLGCLGLPRKCFQFLPWQKERYPCGLGAALDLNKLGSLHRS